MERKIELVHIQPGKPTQNARVESFHARLREECLNLSWFSFAKTYLPETTKKPNRQWVSKISTEPATDQSNCYDKCVINA